MRKGHAGDSEAVLDGGGEPVVLAEAALHKPDEARELKRIRSKVHCAKRKRTPTTLRRAWTYFGDQHGPSFLPVTPGRGWCSARVLARIIVSSDATEKSCNPSQGGVVNRREQRIISPTGHGALNMSRSLGDPAYKQPHRLVSCEPTVKKIELTCAVGSVINCLLYA
jgi:hypothetical protein